MFFLWFLESCDYQVCSIFWKQPSAIWQKTLSIRRLQWTLTLGQWIFPSKTSTEAPWPRSTPGKNRLLDRSATELLLASPAQASSAFRRLYLILLQEGNVSDGVLFCYCRLRSWQYCKKTDLYSYRKGERVDRGVVFTKIFVDVTARSYLHRFVSM